VRTESAISTDGIGLGRPHRREQWRSQKRVGTEQALNAEAVANIALSPV